MALEFDMECTRRPSDITRVYTLPGGEAISVSSARFKAPEIIFSLLEHSEEGLDGLHHVVYQVIHRCDSGLLN